METFDTLWLFLYSFFGMTIRQSLLKAEHRMIKGFIFEEQINDLILMVFVNLMKLNIEFYADRTCSLPYLLVIYRLCKNKISDMPISGKKVSAKS